MNVRIDARIVLFLLLSAVHLVLILLPLELRLELPFAPVVAGSVYLPLMAFKSLGLPVFAIGDSGGWAAPSMLGWGLVSIVWAGLWWLIAGLMTRYSQRRKSHN